MSEHDLIHKALDGESLSEEERRRIADDPLYLELRRMQQALRELPAERFPDAALEPVLQKTRRRRSIWAVTGWAAAAMLILAVGLPLLRPNTSDFSAAEIAAAERQLEQVFGFTSSTIDRSARQNAEQLLRDDVSPALRRVPLIGEGGGS